MMNWTDFHFLRPTALLAFLPFIILFYFWLKRRRQNGSWANICDPQLLPHILLRQDQDPTPTPATFLIAIAGTLAILALAGPTIERLPQPVFREQSALVIALDLSRSMNAEDIKPSRLERARYKIADILNRRQTGQTALLVFAGSAFVVTPLTDDKETILSQLPALTPDIMPVQGGRTDLALQKAMELLQQAGIKNGQILLITDEAETNQTPNTVQKLTQAGYQLSIFGVGTSQGAPIPIADSGFLKDSQGAIVIPTLNETTLMQLSNQGGGIYQHLSISDVDTNALFALLNQQYDKKLESRQATQLHVERWYELGTYLLLLVLPIAALAFKRGYFVFIILITLLSITNPPPAHAEENTTESPSLWQQLWATPDQQASQALQAGDAKTAATLFNDPAWKAAASYKAGQYEQALQTLSGLNTPDSLYNKGNALTKLGKYPEAIEAYKQALAQNPNHEDARYNKEKVEQLLEQQKQEDKKQDKQQDKDKDKKDKENKEDKQKNDKDDKNAQNQQNQQNQQDQQQQNAQQQDDKQQNNKDAAQQHADSQDKPADSSKDEQQAKSQPADKKEDLKKAEEKPAPQSSEKAEKPATDPEKNKETAQANIDETKPMTEEQTAQEQWLRRIPDDPSGLLRRKFQYQYSQQQQPTTGKEW